MRALLLFVVTCSAVATSAARAQDIPLEPYALDGIPRAGGSGGSNTEVFVAQVNFSNASANDSTQFVFHNTTGLFLPVQSTRRLMLEYYQFKTTDTTTTTAQEVNIFADNVMANGDSTMFSVHIKGEGTSPRRYYLRVYKMAASDVAGIAPPLAASYKVLILSQELDALATGRFPAGTGTSVQVRVTLRVRWL
jgi:hypothetical protein